MVRIPPHILYPGLVICLLIFNVSMGITILTAARSDGGAQVVDDYYQKAVNWDEIQALRQQSKALGWKLDLEVQVGTELADKLGHLRIVDAEGQPVSGLTAEVMVRRPNLTEPVAVVQLQELEAGHYVFPNHVADPGIWDFVLKGERDERPYVAELRREFRK
jgi:nitrogen fixation protein FixH